MVFAAIATLAACGGNEDVSRSGVPVTVQVPPRSTVLPGCGTAELESWYEVAGTLVNTFTAESRVATDLSIEQTRVQIGRLATLRDAIADQPVPECARTVHGRLLNQMGIALEAFEHYINGNLTQADLKNQIAATNEAIDGEIAAMLESTRADLENSLRNEQESMEQDG